MVAHGKITDGAAVAREIADDRSNLRSRFVGGRAASDAAIVRKATVIALLEHCGTGNLGDDATVGAVLQQVKDRWPDATLVGLSLDPSDSEQRHEIPFYPIRRGMSCIKKQYTTGANIPTAETIKDKLKRSLRRYRFIYSSVRFFLYCAITIPIHFLQELAFLAKSLRVAATLDVLIVCGGGQLLDAWGGPWQFPYTVLKWVVLSRLSGAKCYFLNVGAGPLDHSLSKKLIRVSLWLAEYVSFRDDKSRLLIKEIGYTGQSVVVADNVYALRLPHAERELKRGARCCGLTVGIAPMAYCDPGRYWQKDEAAYQRLIATLAIFGARLVSDGHRIRLLSTDVWFDSQALIDLEKAICAEVGLENASMVVREPVDNIDDYLGELSCVDCLITCKFHGVVFAHLLNVPVLALAHHPKVSALMHDFDMSEYCLDIDTFCVETLMTAFRKLIDNSREIEAKMSRIVVQHRQALSAQLDELFPPVIARTSSQ